jgi:RHS repeat-associated protein
MPDGTQPNPFPLAAVQVPTDRLPDLKPPVPTMMMVFIVAFQPANVTTNLPVAVYFPNVINTPPGTDMALMTLDPTHGTMVPYGTGIVSADGTTIIPDADPAHPGHLFGLIHFDWHGPMPPPPPQVNPGPPGGGPGNLGSGGGNGEPYTGVTVGSNSGNGEAYGGCSPTALNLPGLDIQRSEQDNPIPGPFRNVLVAANFSPTADTSEAAAEAGDPVDLFSGIMMIANTDISISGGRGSLGVVRTYRSLTTQTGPFGVGTGHNYHYGIDTAFPQLTPVINLIQPDGNRFPFATQPCAQGPCPTGKTNTTIPAFLGAVMTVNSDNSVDLRWKNGTVYHFVPISFQLGSLLASIIDPNGNTISIARDSNGNVTSVTDSVGRTLIFANDSSGRIVSITDPVGRSVQYTYNSQGSLASVTDPAGGVTRYTYDANNNLLQIIDPRGIVQVQNTLDSVGHVIQQTTPDRGTITFSYQFLNPLATTSQVVQAQTTDSLGVQTTYRFNPSGFLTDTIDTVGNDVHYTRGGIGGNQLIYAGQGLAVRFYQYDSFGNIRVSTDPTSRTTLFTYDPVFNKVASITDPAGTVTQFSYDPNGNLLTAKDANGNVTSFQYDSHGLLLQSTDPLGNVTVYAYDTWGNRVSVTDPLGKTTTYAYDGISRLTGTTDALSRQSRFTYDPIGRLLTATDANGGVTAYTYDPNGNVLSVTDARHNSTAYTYDVMNRLATKTDPQGRTETRSYDTDGNLVQVVDRRGVTSTFSYDNVNRLVKESYQDATVTRSYDAYGNLTSVNDSAAGVFTMAYDLAGRIVSAGSPVGAISYSIGPRGEIDDRISSPSQFGIVVYSYDPAGNLTGAVTSVLLGGAGNSYYPDGATFKYDGNNHVTSINRGNGAVSALTYDPAGRLLTIVHSIGAKTLDTESYIYDAVGNRISHSSTTGQALITQPTVNQYNTNNELTLFGGSAYTYDPNGNLLSDGTATYTWDGRNRLHSVSAGSGQTTTFAYDFAGNLIGQTTTGSTGTVSKEFLVDDLGNVASEISSDGTGYSVVSGRTLDSDLVIIPWNQIGGIAEFALKDGINSTIMTVDNTQTVTSQLSYDPFGQTIGTTTYPFQFTGRLPVSSSLLNYRARYYSPVLGRFISEDPAGFAGGINLYRYVSDNPVSGVDPTGLDGTYIPAGWPTPLLFVDEEEVYGPEPPPGFFGPEPDPFWEIRQSIQRKLAKKQHFLMRTHSCVIGDRG